MQASTSRASLRAPAGSGTRDGGSSPAQGRTPSHRLLAHHPGLQPLGSPLPLCGLSSPPREAGGSSAYCQERRSSERSKLFSMSGCFSHKISETEKHLLCASQPGPYFFPSAGSQSPKKDAKPRVPAPADPIPSCSH